MGTCTCSTCGQDYAIGAWPFCPHGVSRSAIQTDEAFIGGITIENMGPEPVTVYSRREFQEQMQLHGVEQRIRHVPGDKHLINWAAGIDAQTLANARELVSRVSKGGKEEPLLPSLRMEHRIVRGDTIVARESLQK